MPTYYIDLDGLEEVRPIYHYVGANGVGMGQYWLEYPMLKKGQWKQEDRFCGCGTFAEAAKYNTTYLKSDLYQPVDQIHKYYEWAAREIDKTKANVKFFHAARDVTGFWGVGGAYHMGHGFGFIGDEAKQLLGDINQALLEFNMPTIKELIKNGESWVVDGEGVMFDLNYVSAEQKKVQKLLDDATPSTEAITDINSQINTFDFTNKKFEVAKRLMNINKLDFRNEKERFAIGFADVIQQRLEAGKVFTDAEKEQISEFVKENLGVEENIFEVIDEIALEKKETIKITKIGVN